MTRSRTPLLLCSLFAAVVAPLAIAGRQDAPPPAGASPETTPAPGTPASDLTIRIVGAARQKIPIALPEFTVTVGDASMKDVAQTIRDVVRDDLDFSGYFTIVPEEYHKLVRDSSDKRVNYKEWLGVGADALLVGQAGTDAAGLVVEGKLYDTSGQKMVLWKRYRGTSDQQRLIAHRLSNEIIQLYSGQAGVSLSRIAFVSQVGKAKEIFVMDYDGARVKRVTAFNTISLSPAWSPDGREIAFTSYRGGTPRLMILSSAGDFHEAAFQQGEELNSAPAWSPDGSLLAFASSRDGNTEIYTLRPADRSLTRVTRNEAIDTSPAWSPNGGEIAFTSDRSGTPQIYIMGSEGKNVRRLSFEVSYCDAPTWSPQGDKIAFTARVPGGFDIYVKDLAKGDLTRVTENGNINEWPRWSPDGRHLAFASNRTGNFDIYIVDADGSNLRRLTHGGNNSSPSWSR
jgi:TolB protein